MADLNEFISSIKSEGLMRNNRYEVMLSPPAVTGFNNYNELRKILLYCDNVTIPGLSISTIPARTYGEYREMPYEKIYAPITLNFYVDNSMQVKKLFDSWITNIQDPNTRNMNYYSTYTTDIDIYVLDVKERARYAVKLFHAYPKDMSAITMDYSNRDVMKLQVTMNYKYWKSSEIIQTDNVEDYIPVPNEYLNNFAGYQSSFYEGTPPESYSPNVALNVPPNAAQGSTQRQSITPNLGGLSLSGASYKF
jgi:hypothetical protein